MSYEGRIRICNFIIRIYNTDHFKKHYHSIGGIAGFAQVDSGGGHFGAEPHLPQRNPVKKKKYKDFLNWMKRFQF